MKRIGIYFFCVVAIGCVTSSILYWKKDAPGKISVEKETEDTQRTESVLKVENNVQECNGYFVIDEDGYLVVYDKKTGVRYDNTSIRVNDLPDYLKEKLADGLYFEDERQLYEFLENYSS